MGSAFGRGSQALTQGVSVHVTDCPHSSSLELGLKLRNSLRRWFRLSHLGPRTICAWAWIFFSSLSLLSVSNNANALGWYASGSAASAACQADLNTVITANPASYCTNVWAGSIVGCSPGNTLCAGPR